jgi:hypothetical protein
MIRSDIATIASLISSVAVCGSLIHLALQVRQFDRNQASLLGFQDQHLLQKFSLMDVIQLESQERAFKVLLCIPVMRAIWNSSRQFYAPTFVSYVDTLLEGMPLAQPRDMGAQLKADVSALTTAELKPRQTG